MIEKLRTLDDIPTNTQLEKNILTICSTYTNKINELCDAVNRILAVQEQYATIYNEDIVPMLTPENQENCRTKGLNNE